jgi:small subunit ribosomal protein S1
MKQLVPTSVDEYIAEHNLGDIVSGRVVEVLPSFTIVELGEGLRANCAAAATPVTPAQAAKPEGGKADLSSLSSMLKARWQGNAPAA